jgi:uncharacterized protein YcnI
MKYKITTATLFVLGLSVIASNASAHVVVKPDQAGIGAFQTFTMGVPSEKPQATIALRLLMPDGLNYVTPNVKSGWHIDVKKIGDKTTEIDWTQGSIPAGQRDDFLFSVQVPANPTTLQWKAYQTYQDGSVVSWDQNPMPAPSNGAMADNDFSSTGPYSRTNVVNDLVTATVAKKTWWETNEVNAAMILSGVAFIISLVVLTKKGTNSDIIK